MAEIIRLVGKEGLPPEVLRKIAKAAASCKIVAFPTDTVYGLGSTGLVKAAARRIYQIKERSTLKPLPVLIHSIKAAQRWVEWTPAAELLARRFWPGALTLVLRPTQEGRLLTFAEYQTVAIRVPDHPVILSLLEASEVPWASTSANISGSPPLQTGEEVIAQFSSLVDFVVSAGTTAGKESTVVDATSLPVRVLREGAVPKTAVLGALEETV